MTGVASQTDKVSQMLFFYANFWVTKLIQKYKKPNTKQNKKDCVNCNKIKKYSEGGALLLEAAELELVLGSCAIPSPSRNMVTAISRLLLHASNICCPTLSVAPAKKKEKHRKVKQ